MTKIAVSIAIEPADVDDSNVEITRRSVHGEGRQPGSLGWRIGSDIGYAIKSLEHSLLKEDFEAIFEAIEGLKP